MMVLTRAQRESLFKVFQRDFPGWVTPWKRKSSNGHEVRVSTMAWRRFRKTVVGEMCGYGAAMVPWHGMWLGIEKDGHVHS